MSLQSKLSSGTTTLDHLILVYNHSMRVRLESENLLTRGFQLKRLALNAEVIATRSSRGGAAFSVMAREVSRLADQITADIGSLVDVGGKLANEAIHAAATSRLVFKYQQALALPLQEYNRRLIASECSRQNDKLRALKQSMQRLLVHTRRNAQSLSRFSVHVPSVGTLFRIEAVQEQDQNTRSSLHGMGDQLNHFSKNMESELEVLFEQINQTLSALAEIH